MGIEVTEKALELMRSIQSLEDLKDKREEVLSLMEEGLRYVLGSLKEVLSKPPEQLQEGMTALEEDHARKEKLEEEVEREMERIAGLPGCAEYIETLKEDMEKRLEPIAQELAETMGELMANVMGDMMGGFVDAMDEAFGGGQEEEDEDE